MSSEFLQSFKVLHALISLVPDTNKTEEQQVQEIVQLQQDNQQASTDLQKELENAERRLYQVQEVYRVLSELKLQCRSEKS